MAAIYMARAGMQAKNTDCDVDCRTLSSILREWPQNVQSANVTADKLLFLVSQGRIPVSQRALPGGTLFARFVACIPQADLLTRPSLSRAESRAWFGACAVQFVALQSIIFL